MVKADRQGTPGCSPLTVVIGAEVSGIDLRAPIPPARLTWLRGALARHHVLFFPNQGLDDDDQRRVASALGPLMVHPFERAMGRTDPIHSIVDRPDEIPDRAGWHTDDSYLERPPAYAVLRCEVAPPVGGDTGWCNMARAFERLSERMKRFLSSLRGVHETDGALVEYVRAHLPPDRLTETLERVGPGAVHPIVRTHPESGLRSLYFEPNYVRRIEGLSPAESRFVCGFLAEQARDVSLQCRYRWREGDVAIWDERTTQHIGAADHAGERRVLRRCLVEGERPA